MKKIIFILSFVGVVCMPFVSAAQAPGLVSFGGQSLFGFPCTCSLPTGVPGAWELICNNATAGIPTPLFIATPPVTDVNLSGLANPATFFIPTTNYVGKYNPLPVMCGQLIAGVCEPFTPPLPPGFWVTTEGNGGLPSGTLASCAAVAAEAASGGIAAGLAAATAAGMVAPKMIDYDPSILTGGASTSAQARTSTDTTTNQSAKTAEIIAEQQLTLKATTYCSEFQRKANAIVRNLEPGMTGEEVAELQEYLIKADAGSAARELAASMSSGRGIYGPKTLAAVAEFQRAKGIAAGRYYGYVGPKTIEYIAAHPIGNSGTVAVPQFAARARTLGLIPFEGKVSYYGFSLNACVDAYKNQDTYKIPEDEKGRDGIIGAFTDWSGKGKNRKPTGDFVYPGDLAVSSDVAAVFKKAGIKQGQKLTLYTADNRKVQTRWMDTRDGTAQFALFSPGGEGERVDLIGFAKGHK